MSYLPQASHRVKLIWDKHSHMCNQAKASDTAEEYYEESICPSCHAKDSQQHWITQCQALRLHSSFEGKHTKREDIQI